MTLDRLMERGRRDGDCIVWTGSCDRAGYGRVRHAYGPYVHRVAWRLSGRGIEPGMELDHTCNRRNCMNIDHLQAVTHAENMRLGVERRSGLCKHGHRKKLAASGLLYCMVCTRAAVLRWHERHPGKAREWSRR